MILTNWKLIWAFHEAGCARHQDFPTREALLNFIERNNIDRSQVIICPPNTQYMEEQPKAIMCVARECQGEPFCPPVIVRAYRNGSTFHTLMEMWQVACKELARLEEKYVDAPVFVNMQVDTANRRILVHTVPAIPEDTFAPRETYLFYLDTDKTASEIIESIYKTEG